MVKQYKWKTYISIYGNDLSGQDRMISNGELVCPIWCRKLLLDNISSTYPERKFLFPSYLPFTLHLRFPVQPLGASETFPMRGKKIWLVRPMLWMADCTAGFHSSLEALLCIKLSTGTFVAPDLGLTYPCDCQKDNGLVWFNKPLVILDDSLSKLDRLQNYN